MRQPKLIEALSAMGAEPFVKPSKEFAQLIQSEYRKWGDIVRKTGAKVN